MAVLVALAGILRAAPADAGCGCSKPPPPPAPVRPNVTYAGAPVTFFGPMLDGTQVYNVTFTSGATGQTATVSGQPTSRRDLADGVWKLQLTVPVPALPLGPTRIVVTRSQQATPDIVIDDASFTVAPNPIAVPAQYGHWHYPNYQAAVGRDGAVYVALDVSALTLPEIFEAQAVGYPLRFGAGDVMFHNTQGFLMQMLLGASAQPVPGMFVFPEPLKTNATRSDKVHYSRHEFTTYFLQHQERQPHAVDPTDGNWHVDGSRHVDHNHLILSIVGKFSNGTVPAPGATPAFDLAVNTYSLFYQGLVGISSVTMSNTATTDAFSSLTDSFTPNGNVLSNGPVTLKNYAVLNGDATGSKFSIAPTARVTGTKTIGTPTTFMDIIVPAGIPTLGSIRLALGTSRTINGPGSFQVTELSVTGGATLYIDNSAGPVTLYVTGGVSMSGGGQIVVADPNPEKFAIYVASTKPVTYSGMNTLFYGVLYAPYSPVGIGGMNSAWYGAFVGHSVNASQSARIHYYGALKGN